MAAETPADWKVVTLRARLRTDGRVGRTGRLIYLLTSCDRDGNQSETIRQMCLGAFPEGKVHHLVLSREVEGPPAGDPAVQQFLREATADRTDKA